jgi:hypothetical protein
MRFSQVPKEYSTLLNNNMDEPAFLCSCRRLLSIWLLPLSAPPSGVGFYKIRMGSIILDQFDTYPWLWHVGSSRHVNTDSQWLWPSKNFDACKARMASTWQFWWWIGAAKGHERQKMQKPTNFQAEFRNFGLVTRWIYLTLSGLCHKNPNFNIRADLNW